MPVIVVININASIERYVNELRLAKRAVIKADKLDIVDGEDTRGGRYLIGVVAGIDSGIVDRLTAQDECIGTGTTIR